MHLTPHTFTFVHVPNVVEPLFNLCLPLFLSMSFGLFTFTLVLIAPLKRQSGVATSTIKKSITMTLYQTRFAQSRLLLLSNQKTNAMGRYFVCGFFSSFLECRSNRNFIQLDHLTLLFSLFGWGKSYATCQQVHGVFVWLFFDCDRKILWRRWNTSWIWLWSIWDMCNTFSIKLIL